MVEVWLVEEGEEPLDVESLLNLAEVGMADHEQCSRREGAL